MNDGVRGALYAGAAVVCVVLAALLHGLILVFLILAAMGLLVAAREAWRRAVR